MRARAWQGKLAVLALGCIAAALALWITRSGIGLSPDSRWYIELARAIDAVGLPLKLAPDGTTSVQSHYPPGYPYLIALAMQLGLSAHEAARCVNAVGIACSTFLIFTAVHYATRNAGRGFLAAILLLLTGGTWTTHVHLWSEPAFQVCMLAAIVCVGRCLHRGGLGWLCVAALLAGYGCTIRYAGIAFVGAALVTLLLAPRPSVGLRRRFAESSLFGALAALPVIAWIAWYSARTQSAAARNISFLWIDREKWNEGLATFGEWLGYGWDGSLGENGVIILGSAGLAFALWIAHASWLAIRRDAVPGEPPFPESVGVDDRPAMIALALPLAYLVIYPLFLITSVSLFDGATPFDRRIFYPLHVAGILLLAAVVPLNTVWWRRVMTLLIIAQAISMGRYLRDVRDSGLGYNSLRWQQSSLIREVRALPADAVIATNNAIAVDLAADRRVIQLARFDRDTFDEADRRREIARLKDRLIDGSYLVLLNSRSKTKAQLSIEDLSDAFHLRLVHEAETGSIYQVDRSPAADAIAATRTSDPTTRRATTRASRKRR